MAYIDGEPEAVVSTCLVSAATLNGRSEEQTLHNENLPSGCFRRLSLASHKLECKANAVSIALRPPNAFVLTVAHATTTTRFCTQNYSGSDNCCGSAGDANLPAPLKAGSSERIHLTQRVDSTAIAQRRHLGRVGVAHQPSLVVDVVETF